MGTATQGGLGQTAPVIRTEQTYVEVRALETGPLIVSLGTGGNSWRSDGPETLLNSVIVQGRNVAVRWKFNPHSSHVDARHITFVYDCLSPRLQLTWDWRARASTGPIEHAIEIKNLTGAEIWIPLQDSFQFQFPVDPKIALEQFYVEKGAGKPSPVGTHRQLVPVGYDWTGTSSTYAHPGQGEPREIIPFFAIENTRTRSGWYAGVEFSGRTRLSIKRDSNSLHGAVGLNPKPGPFRTCLKSGEVFQTPPVFVGAFSGGIDELGNVLRPWEREVLTNPRAWENPNYPLLVNNSWGSGMQVDEQLAQRMIRDSAELGLEMFHVDAGWFRGVGDWYPNPKTFPHGLAAVADYAHQHGLKLGLWVDWTQAGLDNEPEALNLRDPKVRDWAVSDLPPSWKPAPFKGQTIDIGEPAAHAYAQREVLRIIESYRLDMLEHDGYLVAQGCVRKDHPHAPPDPARTSVVENEGSYFVESSNMTDVSYHSVRAYYAIYEKVRQQHPNVLLEVCNDGGRMVDFGSASHGDYFSITDSYDPVSNRQAFYDASHVLPTAMLECYVEKWPTPTIENFRYMLRSGMLGWLTIMQDTTAWTEQQHAAAKQEIQLYKKELRPLIRNAGLYHIAPRPDGVHWDGIEFFDRRRNQGVVYAFHGSSRTEIEHTFQLAGLLPGKNYQLRFRDKSASDRVVAGHDLLASGLTVKLPAPNSSELIFITGSTKD
jgi:hypothetical protein